MTTTPATSRSPGTLPNPLLKTSGTGLATHDGTPVRLRGAGLGGWMNMENFITGYPGNEDAMRSAVRNVLGERRYELFFDRLLTVFLADEFPGFTAQPFSTRQWLDVLIRHIMLGQPLLQEYAELFRGLHDDDVLALADSFALNHCVQRDRHLDMLANG